MAWGSGGLLAGCGPQRMSSEDITVWKEQMRESSWGVSPPVVSLLTGIHIVQTERLPVGKSDSKCGPLQGPDL